MDLIHATEEEKKISANSLIGTRQNSVRIDYFNKVNDKPWGKEYLAYQNNEIGIWILHINKDQETSLHCHFKKDTILIPLSGCFKINLYNNFKILNLFETLYIPRQTFHGLHSYCDNGIIMEIEIYTQTITYTDKNDLLRIKDIYNRDKNSYETSVTERKPNEKEIMFFENNNIYEINDSTLTVLNKNTLTDLKSKYEKVIILEGSLYSNGKKITSGSFIDFENDNLLLTESIKLLCLSNLDYKNVKKIIYSKTHLRDLLELKKINNAGLTSGCFDILHHGHIQNLKTCKKNCDLLFVCLSSDEQINRLKGVKRPINNLTDRINMLINFDFIDFVILYEEINDILETELDTIINIINPRVWFKGKDYNMEDIFKKHPTLKSIQLIDFVEGKSTTNIIKKINAYK